MKPHKHAEIIKQWADGVEVEYRLNDGVKGWSEWKMLAQDKPFLSDDWWEYRIKPDPDQISYLLLNYPNKDKWFEYDYPCEHNCIKIVRDRKTGKLKSAEVIS